MIRTYPLQHSINKGKQEKIMAVAREYRKVAVKLAALQWQQFYRHGDFDKNLDIKVVETALSERYKQTCQYQVIGVLESFISNRQNEFVRMVWRSALAEKTKHQLFYINKYQLWFGKCPDGHKQVQMRKGDEDKKVKGEKARKIKALEKAQEDVARLEKECKAFEESRGKDSEVDNDPLVVEFIIKTQDTLERARLRLSDLQKAEEDKKGEAESVSVPPEILKLARAIFKHILSQHRRPSLRHCNLALDNKVAQVNVREESEKKKAKKFAYWITFATLEPRKVIYLPLATNEYFQDKSGVLKRFCQINIGEQERLTLCLIKDIAKRAYVPQTPKIALDFGMRNLFATDTGDLYGRDFIEVLKKYDRYLTPLASNRQRQGLVVKSHLYNTLVSHLRNFLKNEIARVLNRIIAVYRPQEIVVENLNFTSPKLSRRLNRLVSNMGRKIIREKFASINEEFGIVITEVPAPYSSQECSLCGYVDKLNRKNQSTFICRHCHKKLHADVNGARNLFDRSSTKELSNVYLSKEAILDILLEQFLQRYPDISTGAPFLVESNPYFKAGRQHEPTGNLKYG